MERKQRLFIYDRKEMVVLILLGVAVAFFAFTLGIHLGKRVPPKPTTVAQQPEAAPVATVPDQTPNRQEFQEQSKNVAQAVDESLSQSLHEEVQRTGIKLDTPRQVELPNKVRTSERGAATPEAKKAEPAVADFAAAQRPAPHGKFTLQIGSYPSVQEAKDQVEAVEALGLKPYLRSAEIKGKGKWYRVYLGGYEEKAEAEKAGEKFRSQHVIDKFIVSKAVE